MKVAITFSYLGYEFHGSQIQPSLKTVQGEIEKACRRLKWSSNGVKICSRTDSGVNARMNYALIDVPKGIEDDLPQGLLKGLNDILPSSICVYDANKVDEDCNIRSAKMRTYRYRLEMLEKWNYKLDLKNFKEILKLFSGTHDFFNFYKQEDERSTIRTITKITPWVSKDNRLIGFEIKSKGFLWNQVRRIASCIIKLINEEISKDDVSKSLVTGCKKLDFGLAPSRWLILWDIEHKDLQKKHSSIFFDPPKPSRLTNDRRVNSIIIEADAKKHHAWLQNESANLLINNL